MASITNLRSRPFFSGSQLGRSLVGQAQLEELDLTLGRARQAGGRGQRSSSSRRSPGGRSCTRLLDLHPGTTATTPSRACEQRLEVAQQILFAARSDPGNPRLARPYPPVDPGSTGVSPEWVALVRSSAPAWPVEGSQPATGPHLPPLRRNASPDGVGRAGRRARPAACRSPEGNDTGARRASPRPRPPPSRQSPLRDQVDQVLEHGAGDGQRPRVDEHQDRQQLGDQPALAHSPRGRRAS